MNLIKNFNTIIIGAGAAGLMCAIEAAKRGRRVLVLDHANKAGKKIIMSGGGRCNFTNYYVAPDRFMSHNPHFCKSALSRYTQWHFIEWVKKSNVAFHEKTLGQLFCNEKSQAIVDMLLAACAENKVDIRLNHSIQHIEKNFNSDFQIITEQETFAAEALVMATGGLSIPTMGASPFGYKIAEQFQIPVWPTRAGLVPLTLQPNDKAALNHLIGVATEAIVTNHQTSFQENILFTHRGLSGPAILQISSYWQPGEMLQINLYPQKELLSDIKAAQQQRGQQTIKNFLIEKLPRALVQHFLPETLANLRLAEISNQQIQEIYEIFQHWSIKPNSTEGYRTAEVTLGGVDCDYLSSKTMEAKTVSGLFFIGEVVDVTGWLGGYNFQWAWSSGWAAGQAV